MQAAFGPHVSTKLFKKLFSFDESLTSTNSISNRYFYPVCPPEAGYPSSLIQIKEFSDPAKAGRIVPHEVICLNVVARALSSNLNALLFDH